MSKRLTKRQAAIIGAYTGITASDFSVVHEYAEEKFGHPVWTHESASKVLSEKLKELAKQDFIDICYDGVEAPEADFND